MDFFKKGEQDLQTNRMSLEIQKQPIFFGAVLELLRDLRERIERLDLRLMNLEKKFEERIPEKNLSERVFMQEIVDTDEIVKKISSEIKSIARPIIASREQLSLVESKKIQKIVSILQDHGKLSSSQLAKILNLSRTRCNEYFKKMEELGIAEGITIGKEKYYRLKD